MNWNVHHLHEIYDLAVGQRGDHFFASSPWQKQYPLRITTEHN